MRNYTIITRVLLVFTLLFIYTKSNAQVGINTTTSRATLEVNGNMQVSNAIEIGTLNNLNNADSYTFLMQESSGNIKALDVANVSLGNALGYIQTYEIQEVYYDFLRDFDTGIGTTAPSEMLEVMGNALVTQNLKIQNLQDVPPSEENFKLLSRVTNSTPVVGMLKKLNPNVIDVAPMRMQNYTITNVKKDDVKDLDLQLSTTDYIVSISNFRCTGSYLKKKSSKMKSSGLFEYKVYQSGGTWHLTIRNKFLNTPGSSSMTYEVSLIIYQKRFFKQLPQITENLGGSQTGTATVVPL